MSRTECEICKKKMRRGDDWSVRLNGVYHDFCSKEHRNEFLSKQILSNDNKMLHIQDWEFITAQLDKNDSQNTKDAKEYAVEVTRLIGLDLLDFGDGYNGWKLKQGDLSLTFGYGREVLGFSLMVMLEDDHDLLYSGSMKITDDCTAESQGNYIREICRQLGFSLP